MQWRDSQNRAWSCRLTIADAKRLKAAGVDIGNPETYKALFGDALSIIEVIAEALRPQWEKAGLTYEEFADVLIETESSLATAIECFNAGLKDFFRRLGENAKATIVEKAEQAAKLSKAAQEKRANSSQVDSLIRKALEEEEKLFQSELAKEEAKLFGERYMSAQES